MKKNKIIRTLLFVLLFFATVQMPAQTDKEQELLKMEQELASGNLSDEERFKYYDDLMYEYSERGEVEKTKYYFNKAVAFAREKKKVEEESAFFTAMGESYFIFGEQDSAFIYLDKALQLVEGTEYYEEGYRNYMARGNVHSDLADYEKAMHSYLKALELNEKDKQQNINHKQSVEKNLNNETKVLNNMGNIYGMTLNYEKAIEIYLQAVKLMEANPTVDFGRRQMNIATNLGKLYIVVNELDKAYPMIKKAYELASAKEDLIVMINILGNFATYYSVCKNHIQALHYSEEALRIAEKTNLPRQIFQSEKNLIYRYFLVHDYTKALYYAERVFSKIPENDWSNLHYIYIAMSMIDAATGNVEKSYEYVGKTQGMIGKISDENRHAALQEMEVKYEVEQKELKHQAEIKRHQTFRYFLIAGLLTAAVLIALLIYIVTLRNKRNRELAEMNATKDKFFNIISHDLKNPAVAQRDALQLLLSNADQWDTDSLTEYYRKLLHLADSQVVLLYNLLNWAQLQTGRMTYMPMTFNLTEALEQEIVLIQNMAEQKGITLNTHIPEIVLVTGDNNMLSIVVRNLLTNAVKFTSAGGTITLDIVPSATGRKFATSTETEYTLSISDTGTGMSPEQLQNLFCLGKKTSRLGTAGEQGSGLGLIVCKELVEKHGSILHVESTEGKGCRFWFEI